MKSLENRYKQIIFLKMIPRIIPSYSSSKPSSSGGNKFYKPEPIDVTIVLKAKLIFESDAELPTSKEVWTDFDRGLDYIWRTANTILSDNNLQFVIRELNDKVEGDILTIVIKKIDTIYPTEFPCKTKGCPYRNYFAVCRNCEDNVSYDSHLYDCFMKDLDVHKKLIKNVISGTMYFPSKKLHVDDSIQIDDEDDEHDITMYVDVIE